MPEILHINKYQIFFVAPLASTKELKTQKFKARAQDHRSGSVASTHLSSDSASLSFNGTRLTVYEGNIPGTQSRNLHEIS